MVEDFEIEDAAEEPSSNRTFILVAVGMGAVLLLSIACLAGYLFFWVPRQQAAQEAQQATEIAAASVQETEAALLLTQSAEPSATATLEPPTAEPTFTASLTATVTETPVIVQPAETETEVPETVEGTAATFTAEAELTSTSLALGQDGDETPTPAATALPQTGFADTAPPQLILLTLALIAVVVAIRQLRKRWAS